MNPVYVVKTINKFRHYVRYKNKLSSAYASFTHYTLHITIIWGEHHKNYNMTNKNMHKNCSSIKPTHSHVHRNKTKLTPKKKNKINRRVADHCLIFCFFIYFFFFCVCVSGSVPARMLSVWRLSLKCIAPVRTHAFGIDHM